ncbi:putative N6-adenine methyltransferase-domain-containing protein [Chaetomium sp. MPI-SDFR-AT-0129]|nr:putative N6-adenine methyltransferase-domain-containing protein [Chaetomium sp. MPI-SDFR-AT-0129]
MTSPSLSDDDLTLSSTTLDALKSFYAERDARAEQFAKLQAQAEALHDAETGEEDVATAVKEPEVLSMEAFGEDWNESQFWVCMLFFIFEVEENGGGFESYADETADLYAQELLDGVTADSTIAVVSTPSVFVALKKALRSAPPEQPKPKLLLLEHDNRFGVFQEFVYYDFAQPLKLPAELKSTCDRIIADPPFLSEDCQTKTALTVRWLSRPSNASSSSSSSTTRVIVSTGERMSDIVQRVYRSFGIRVTNYDPVHARGLSNEFWCYANYESGRGSWGWR